MTSQAQKEEGYLLPVQIDSHRVIPRLPDFAPVSNNGQNSHPDSQPPPTF
jgi:hypothetical protein